MLFTVVLNRDLARKLFGNASAMTSASVWSSRSTNPSACSAKLSSVISIVFGPSTMKSAQPFSICATCLTSPPSVSSLAVSRCRACSSEMPWTA